MNLVVILLLSALGMALLLGLLALLVVLFSSRRAKQDREAERERADVDSPVF